MKRTSAPSEIVSNGIVFKMIVGKDNKDIIKEAQTKGLRYRTVNVITSSMLSRIDLHGNPYRPSVFIYVEKTCNCVTMHYFDYANSVDVNGICKKCNLKRI